MESITTSDFYEAAYYLLNHYSINTIQCLLVNGKVTCQFIFEGENPGPVQLSYFQGKAEVNLLQFRRAYGQVNSYAYEAKKKWKQQQRQEICPPKKGK
ncbi:MAG: hypothetical protein J7K04_14060 [Spirochaetales bacterium]|nr:hypothetical protein [Spirochaetales bacterium]